VLPGAAYAEKHGTYVNIEGRVQRSERAAFAPGDARDDWTIFRALSDLIGKPLPFDPLRPAARGDDRRGSGAGSGRDHRPAMGSAKAGQKGVGPVRYPIKDFYLTNAICRASPTMRRCSKSWSRAVSIWRPRMTAWFQSTWLR
jgi:NADH-quinone oxidoreductase subunit G